MRSALSLLIFLALFSPLAGQQKTLPPSLMLEGMFSRLIQSSDDRTRIAINDSITAIIDKYAASDSVMVHKFTNLRYLGQITSPDQKVKFINWNLVLRNSQSYYFSYLIRKGETGSKNIVYKMRAPYRKEPPLVDGLYTDRNWYGALYFDIRPMKTSKGTFWMLFGIDYGNPDITRKIIDVLSFTEKGTVVFGKKWFVAGETVRSREIFEYSSEGTMILRFDSDKEIVFDHLAPFTPEQIGEYQFYGASAKYDSYVFKKGLWHLTENVDARNKKPKKK